MKALLIIDMQKGCFAPYSSRHDTMGIVARINTLSEAFRKRRYPVIFIQHDGTQENELLPNTDDWTLLPELTALSTDHYVHKTANDSFYNTTLQQTLNELGIEELFITGSATDFCVDATIKSAIVKDYKVIVPADCHTTGDREHIAASTLIEHYNWVWSAMSPTKHSTTVQKVNDLIIK